MSGPLHRPVRRGEGVYFVVLRGNDDLAADDNWLRAQVAVERVDVHAAEALASPGSVLSLPWRVLSP